MDNRTVINPQINSNVTSVNSAISVSNATSINTEILNCTEIQAGTLLNGKYEVVVKMEVPTGESDLYICRYNNSGYVAKIYRRNMAVKEEVVEGLKKINSPYIARLYDTGTYNNLPFEILPYYKQGSLQSKRYTFDQLKETIIPSLNEGLRTLHQNGIIHKDIKPSNIMLCDNGRDIVIIDFGVSSVAEKGATVIVTQTGKTPVYSAPETFRDLFLVESDYYSFGITVYELFCGHTPYHGMSNDEYEKFVAIQRIPFPENMPTELKNFISALTHYDITNRKNKDNPNRRWTYDEVCKWLKGEKQTIPGEGIGNSKQAMPPYEFLKEAYTNMPGLVNALAMNWNDGKKQLFRGLLSAFFKLFNPKIAGYCMDAEEEATKGANDDFVFWKLLYKLDEQIKTFYWHDQAFEGLPALGRQILEQLRKGDTKQISYYDTIFKSKLLSNYIMLTNPKNAALIDATTGLEGAWIHECSSERDKLLHLYTVGYMLSGQKLLHIDNLDFRTVGELSAYMKTLLDGSYEAFEEFCHRMIDYGDNLDVQLEAWLLTLGKRNELARWRESLMG